MSSLKKSLKPKSVVLQTLDTDDIKPEFVDKIGEHVLTGNNRDVLLDKVSENATKVLKNRPDVHDVAANVQSVSHTVGDNIINHMVPHKTLSPNQPEVVTNRSMGQMSQVSLSEQPRRGLFGFGKDEEDTTDNPMPDIMGDMSDLVIGTFDTAHEIYHEGTKELLGFTPPCVVCAAERKQKRDARRERREEVRENVGEFFGDAKDFAGDLYDDAKDGLGNFMDGAKDIYEAWQDRREERKGSQSEQTEQTDLQETQNGERQSYRKGRALPSMIDDLMTQLQQPRNSGGDYGDDE